MLPLSKLSDGALSRFGHDNAALILQKMEKVGEDMLAGNITPEQSDIDIGLLLEQLKAIENAVNAEKDRRQREKKTLNRIIAVLVIAISATAIYAFFYQ